MLLRDSLRIYLREIDDLEAHVDCWQRHVSYAQEMRRSYIDRLDICSAYDVEVPARQLGVVAAGTGRDITIGEVARCLDAGGYPEGVSHNLRAAVARYLLRSADVVA